MQLSRRAKLILGALNLVAVLSLAAFFYRASPPPVSGDVEAPEPLIVKLPFAAMALLGPLFVWCLVAFYAVFIFRTPRLSTNSKLFWWVLVFAFNVLVMPLFWYLYIWPETCQPALPPAPTPKPVPDRRAPWRVTRLMAAIVAAIMLPPVLLFPAFYIAVVAAVAWRGGAHPPIPDRNAVILVMAAALWNFVVLLFFEAYVFRSGRVPREKRTLWFYLLALASYGAMPVFWYLYMWRPAKIQPAPPGCAGSSECS